MRWMDAACGMSVCPSGDLATYQHNNITTSTLIGPSCCVCCLCWRAALFCALTHCVIAAPVHCCGCSQIKRTPFE